MTNVVSIGTENSQESFAVQPQVAVTSIGTVPKQDLQVTERAIQRIRLAMAKEGVSAEEGGLRLGVMGGGCSGLSY